MLRFRRCWWRRKTPVPSNNSISQNWLHQRNNDDVRRKPDFIFLHFFIFYFCTLKYLFTLGGGKLIKTQLLKMQLIKMQLLKKQLLKKQLIKTGLINTTHSYRTTQNMNDQNMTAKARQLKIQLVISQSNKNL